ncbi:MAG: thermonuclease family protein [Candidatus Omnitrophica bacterium]|nr:thermonuclease family protein [Candidatus Omnitrophota bacterium]
MTKTLSSHFYQTILKKIKDEIVRGRKTIEESYRREVLKTHWNIGQILEQPFVGELGCNSERASMVSKLAKDLNRPRSFFYDLSKFYRFYSSIPKTSLSWSHYSNLIRVEDEKERKKLEDKAIKESLSALKLYQLIFSEKIEKKKKEENKQLEILAKPGILPCIRGKLYRYRCLFRKGIPCAKAQALVDMGFGFLRTINIPDWKSNGSPTPIRSYKNKKGYFVRRATKHPEYLYTYQATVTRVIDGDTIILNIDLGFDSWIEQKLRLRGIDTPEISSVSGIAAKEYVKKICAKVDFVICKTYKEDKYGRYLADILYHLNEKDPELVAEKGTYLNQELIDQGYAVIY